MEKVFSGEKDREWVSVVCDGVPYDFVSQIQDNSMICGVYSTAIFRSLDP